MLDVRYANDGESILSRLRIREDGRLPIGDGGDGGDGDSGDRGEGVDVVFEWEAGVDGRGWTYLSCGDSGLGNLEWTSDPSQIPNPINHDTDPSTIQQQHPNTNGNGNGNPHGDGGPNGNRETGMGSGMEMEGGGEAPAGYWTGFSPPTSPSLNSGTDPDHHGMGDGEDDYWASYGKIYTPGGTPSATPGGVTPAIQSTPGPSRRNSSTNLHHQVLSSHLAKNVNDLASKSTPGPTQSHSQPQSHSQSQSQSQTSSTSTYTTGGDGDDTGSKLLRSRISMKIASLLKRIWTSYLPGSDMESRALTFLSLARQVQSKSSKPVSNGNGNGNGNGYGYGGVVSRQDEAGDGDGVRERLEILYEIYEVMDPKSEDGEGFYRLVEGCLTTKPGEAQGGGEGERGFGMGNRQDSSAQLNYWE